MTVLQLGVRVKMATGDQLAIAKETRRRLDLGDHMYPAKVLKEGPAPGSKHANLDEMDSQRYFLNTNTRFSSASVIYVP